MTKPVLYDYWRSSASYRVRIALHLARVDYETVVINLLDKSQKSDAHLARNPQGLVPALEINGEVLTQSLAIIDYLAELHGLTLWPCDPIAKAKAQALAYTIAMDTHPVCNLPVVGYAAELSGKDGTREDWMRRFIRPGLVAFEAQLSAFDQAPFCCGDTPMMPDLCLIPQIYNADRWGADISDLPRLNAVAEACAKVPAFQAAHPDQNNH